VPDVVLLDRDGTLVVDVPYNGEPAAVVPMEGAAPALRRLRAAGCRLAVVTNQSGIARGLLSEAQVAAVNQRLAELLGPFDLVLVCPHGPTSDCACRKPRPGLLLEAMCRLRVSAARTAMVGDIGADMEAGRTAGVRSILVPTAVTLADEVCAAPEVAPDIGGAVDLLLRTGSRR
jgi:histidinol-phosphate phosphatase family protein